MSAYAKDVNSVTYDSLEMLDSFNILDSDYAKYNDYMKHNAKKEPYKLQQSYIDTFNKEVMSKYCKYNHISPIGLPTFAELDYRISENKEYTCYSIIYEKKPEYLYMLSAFYQYLVVFDSKGNIVRHRFLFRRGDIYNLKHTFNDDAVLLKHKNMYNDLEEYIV